MAWPLEQLAADVALDRLLSFRTTATSKAYGDYGSVAGSRINQRTYDALTVAAYISGWGPLVITQGGLNGGLVAASAKTHNGLDVADVRSVGRSKSDIFSLISAGMECGVILFIRGESWDTISDGMVTHLHGVMVGAQHAHPDAHAQLYNTRYGYSYGGAGLAGLPSARWYGPPRKPLVEWADSGFNPVNGWAP